MQGDSAQCDTSATYLLDTQKVCDLLAIIVTAIDQNFIGLGDERWFHGVNTSSDDGQLYHAHLSIRDYVRKSSASLPHLQVGGLLSSIPSRGCTSHGPSLSGRRLA